MFDPFTQRPEPKSTLVRRHRGRALSRGGVLALLSGPGTRGRQVVRVCPSGGAGLGPGSWTRHLQKRPDRSRVHPWNRVGAPSVPT